MTKTISIPAAQYEDCDDCLTAAAEDYAEEHGLQGWDLSPRWVDEDTDRSAILLDVPCDERCDHPRMADPCGQNAGTCEECGERCTHDADGSGDDDVCHDHDCPIHGSGA